MLFRSAMALFGLVLFVLVRPAIHHAVSQPTEQGAVLPALPAAPPQPRPALSAPPKPPAPAVHVEAPRVADANAPHPAPPAPRAPTAAAQPASEAPRVPALEPVYDATPAPPSDAELNEPSGIQVFPPRGTNPLKPGIVVPDDFELPPGYVRHYQNTDDGYQLPPILMFDEDFHPVDEHGNPIPLPEDLVVPPEMAPPGLTVQILQVPTPRESGSVPRPGEPQEPPPGGIRHRQ